jgi:hypothetical protein
MPVTIKDYSNIIIIIIIIYYYYKLYFDTVESSVKIYII